MSSKSSDDTNSEDEIEISKIASYALEMLSRSTAEISKQSLLANVMHMHYNRLFPIKQRQHEYVIYYMLSNFYKSAMMRMHKQPSIE